ncbi:PLP-dependent aminotransferase family protein [Burkholderia sp. JP2-270]|uniref:aminotransferase-like domain-containing protein n=1 Tax=Burkholderia sp. JP2-270 TaxID=2217913 RepID=UPI0013A6D631|nr:PLP-dependent aminotransferase family protein [Burkholderia sp. JP2-270]
MDTSMPRYRQLAQRLWDGIVQAGLANGSRLPSVRTLAAQHGVSLTTALQALRWLETQGNIQARPRSGYYVARLAERENSARTVRWPNPLPELDAQARDHLAMVGSPCAVRLDLAAGEPSLYPVDRFGVLLRRLAYQQKNLVGAHVRGTGHPELRREIVRQAMQYPCDLDPDELVITNGCVEALNLALRAVTRPGDVVAVESPTYFALLQMLRALELTALPIPCLPAIGMDLDVLRDALDQVPVKAVVTIANANNPVGSVAPDTAKRALVELLRGRNIPLVEDDIFGDVCFGETRPRPVRAFDTDGNVLLCGGFSKSLCPGLRLGWIAAGRFTERVKALKYTTSMATAELQQVAVAEMLAGGGYALHLRRLKTALQHQQRSLRDAILRYFPVGTEVSSPAGGFVLWVRLPRINGRFVSTRPLFEQARAEGIGFTPGHLFGQGQAFDDCLRVNAGYRWTNELEAAIERLGALAKITSFSAKTSVTSRP